MEEKLTKKYGLFTAIAMVVGIVIGSGVFFKAQDILMMLGGNMPLGIVAWLVGGAVMLACACTFAVMATKYENVGGVVDYAEAVCGKRYAYMTSWFIAAIYFPGMASVLAWVSARYLGELFGWGLASGEVMTFAGFLLVLTYCINSISPKLAGKFQVSATIIKLIPLFLMAVVGLIAGLANGNIAASFTSIRFEVDNTAVFGAIVSTAFAYEGWIIATSINAEIRDAKKNLPLALLIGGIAIVVIYVLYYVGISGAIDIDTLIQDGASAAFTALFGSWFGVVLKVFIVVSCLGTLNGLMLANARTFYVVSTREENPAFGFFRDLNPHTNIPSNSAVMGLLMTAVWLLYFYGANLTEGWFGVFNFDSSELPIITVYAFYIPIFVNFMRKEREMGVVRRFVLPGFAVLGSIFMIAATVYAHGIRPFLLGKAEGRFVFPVLFYLILFIVIMAVGFAIDHFGRKRV